jgi:hypothetical protein
MMVIRSSQVPAYGTPETEHGTDPLQEQAAELFAEQLAADRVPSVRAIRAQLHVGQPRAQRLRDYLATGAQGGWKVPLPEQLMGRGVIPVSEMKRGAALGRRPALGTVGGQQA